MTKSRSVDDTYSEQETIERRETALKRMLSTPHKLHKPIGKKKGSPRKRAAIGQKSRDRDR